MKEELLLIKEIYSSKHKLAIRNYEKRIYNILLFSYVKACVLKKTEYYVLFFDGKYVQSRRERILDWLHYCIDKCYEVYYKTFKPNDDKTLRKYSLIHYGTKKPIHIKVSNCPNEWILEKILARHGFKIIDEHIYSIATEYEIGKLEVTAGKTTIN